MAKNILITPNTTDPSDNPRIDFTGASTGSIYLEVLQNGTISFMGNNGALFTITDDASGSLMSVNNISGLPIFEVWSMNNANDQVDVNGYLKVDGSIKANALSLITLPINPSDAVNKIYVDTFLPEVSLNDSYFKWVNGFVEPSIISDVTKAYVDSSLGKFVKSSSVGNTMYWHDGIFDVSAVGDVTKAYVDSSLGMFIRSASLGGEFYWENELFHVDTSIVTDYDAYKPFVGDISLGYTNGMVTSIVTTTYLGTKTITLNYDSNKDVSIVNINNYDAVNRRITFSRDVYRNLTKVFIT